MQDSHSAKKTIQFFDEMQSALADVTSMADDNKVRQIYAIYERWLKLYRIIS